MKEHENTRLVKWEDILKKPRSGTLTDIDINFSVLECKLISQLQRTLEITETKLINKTEKELREISTALKETKNDLLNTITE